MHKVLLAASFKSDYNLILLLCIGGNIFCDQITDRRDSILRQNICGCICSYACGMMEIEGFAFLWNLC
jgi:hypothetical protein